MARKKRQFLEDSDSDSASSEGGDGGFDETNDPDARAERELFADPYNHKRRQRDGKKDALYGVFASDDEDEGFGRKQRGGKEKRSDWTKAPAFVSGDTEKPSEEINKAMEEDEEDESEESEGDGEVEAQLEQKDDSDAMDTSDSEPSRPASPRMLVEGDHEEAKGLAPQIGGLGFGKSGGGLGFGRNTGGGLGFGKSTGGLGFSKATSSGLGFTSPKTTTTETMKFTSTPEPPTQSSSPPPSTSSANFPSSFGGDGRSTSAHNKPRPQRAFMREETPSSKAKVALSREEASHFTKLSGSFGARMLSKMGWEAGTGLGSSGEGIVTPIESKLRPQRAGIAHGGFREKTKQSVAEARRKGEIISDDEDDTGARKKAGKGKAAPQKKREEAWKRPKKVKTRVEHKTYEQIIAEAGEEQASYSGIGQIIDATGATPREVSSLAEVSMASWTPSTDPTRIPEVRHNLRMIVDASKADLDSLAREAKALEDRKKALTLEEARLGKKVAHEADLIARLQQVHLVADDINTQAKEQASTYEVSLDSFTPAFEKLLAQYTKEYDRYNLDEVVVAAIAPIFRRMLTSWDPLEDPAAFTATFRLWRGLLKTTAPPEPQTQLDVYGTRTTSAAPLIEKPMTPFESLMWNAWMPKIRSVVNNSWSADDPQPLIRVYEAWASFLPAFVRDNFFDQLVLPKVQNAVAEWSAWKAVQTGVTLRTLIFPWLPHLGLRVESLLDDARRKIKSLLRAWTPLEDVPTDLAAWKEVFASAVWDNMTLKYVVPKLGALLRDDFKVNPRAQDDTPIRRVLAWAGVASGQDLLRPSVIASLFETGFFPKWLDVLHVWLTAPGANYAQIADWYTQWVALFPERVQALPQVRAGFTLGQQMMHTALALGPSAAATLAKPVFPPASADRTKATSKPTPAARLAPTAPAKEITFRDIVEEEAAQHNLLFIPAGRVHAKSRMPLFKVTTRADGRGGLLVYVMDDAVWAADPASAVGEDDEWRAISLENMVLRATKGGGA